MDEQKKPEGIGLELDGSEMLKLIMFNCSNQM